MDYLSHNNGNKQMSELGSDTTSVVLRNDEIKTVTYGDTIERRGVKMRKVTRIKLVPRRTFIKGTLKGKYWGEHEKNDASPKDIGQFYNITLYESEISVDREVIRTEGSTTFSDFLTEISRANSFTSYHHIDPSQLKNNFLVVHHEGIVNRYKIDLHEPRLYNTKIVHALHQSSDQEVFGSIESNICGYLLDKKEVIEESYEVIEEPAKPTQDETTSTVSSESEKEKKKVTDQEEVPYGPIIPEPSDHTIKSSKWSLLPLFLLLLLCLLAFISFGNISFWILPIAALLFFIFQKPGFKLPKWLFLVLLSLIGVLLWNAFKHDTPIAKGISEFLDQSPFSGNANGENNGNSPSGQFKGDVKDQTATTPSKKMPNVGDSTGQKVAPPTVSPEPSLAKTETKSIEEVDETQTSSVNSKITSFNSYLSKGLKAVEDEEYTLANQNFRLASNLDPSNPRLKQLADRYKKLADEKCQDFRSANAKELMHIPNNYYQYAASLTQTAPLKCE